MGAEPSVVAGEIVEEPDAQGVAGVASVRIARCLADAILAGGSATLALSGGNTPGGTYALLARSAEIDWSKVSVFWVDERAVPPVHDRSNYRAARVTLLEAARIPDDHVHRMRADAPDLEAAAREYESLLSAYVGRGDSAVPCFDVVVLGMGDDGHTASLFPGEPTAGITDRLVASVPSRGAREARLTLTAPVIQAAKNVFVLVVGPEKRDPLARAWAPAGDVLKTPIRLVRSCRGRVAWIVDRSARPSSGL
jgi:6-phosphogluconolactonase